MPILTYHGTPWSFSSFQMSPEGIHFGTYDQATHACTLKLSLMSLAEFKQTTPDTSGWRGRIMQVRLHPKNLKRVKDARSPVAWREAIKKARAEGHDALVYRNEYEGRDVADSYVVFDTQIIEIVDPSYKASLAAA